MTKAKRQKIEKLIDKAIEQFLSYQNTCQKIERYLDEETEEPHLEVLYQPSDGLVVSVDRNGYAYDNIPISDYIEELDDD